MTHGTPPYAHTCAHPAKGIGPWRCPTCDQGWVFDGKGFWRAVTIRRWAEAHAAHTARLEAAEAELAAECIGPKFAPTDDRHMWMVDEGYLTDGETVMGVTGSWRYLSKTSNAQRLMVSAKPLTPKKADEWMFTWHRLGPNGFTDPPDWVQRWSAPAHQIFHAEALERYRLIETLRPDRREPFDFGWCREYDRTQAEL